MSKMPDILSGLLRRAGHADPSSNPPPDSGKDLEESGTREEEDEALVDESRWDSSVEDPYLRKLGEMIRRQNLPVSEQREALAEEFAKSLDEDGVLFFEAETGSGKSLYTPLILRKELRAQGRPEQVIMVVNRKDAARNAARGMAAISEERLGEDIAFSTSEEKMIDPGASIAVVTSGIFLRWIKEGKISKDKIGAVILDEAHEVSEDYDLILGFLKDLRRRELAPPLVLMSATLPTEGLQEHFEVEPKESFFIEGRQYPVEVAFEGGHKREGYNYIAHAAEVVNRECQKKEDGDILVFMPGMAEIQDTIMRIEPTQGIQVMSLYGDMSPHERDAILISDRPPGIRRRVIVSTNVAETSITPPAVTLVIDPCRQRAVYFDYDKGTQRTGTEFISQQQAEQRRGRAGRVREGRAIRLLNESDFDSLNEYPIPDIERANLSQLILRLADMGAHPLDFDFPHRPSQEALEHGERELKLLQALDEEGKLTDVGREMARLPFESRIARLLVEARRTGCLEAALILAAFTRENKVFDDPEDMNQRSRVKNDRAHFSRADSDWLRCLNIFSEAIEFGVYEYHQLKKRQECSGRGELSEEEFRRLHVFEEWCKKYRFRPLALSHIAYRLTDYARSAAVRLDRRTLTETLRKASDAAIGDAILAAHPDTLFHHAGRFSRLLTGEREGSISVPRMSEAWGTSGLCVAQKLIKQDAVDSGIVRRDSLRAFRVHPLTPQQVEKKFPDLLERSLAIPRLSHHLVWEYNSQTGVIDAQVEYREKGYGWSSLEPEQLSLPCREFFILLIKYLEKKLTNTYNDVSTVTLDICKDEIDRALLLYKDHIGASAQPELIALQRLDQRIRTIRREQAAARAKGESLYSYALFSSHPENRPSIPKETPVENPFVKHFRSDQRGSLEAQGAASLSPKPLGDVKKPQQNVEVKKEKNVLTTDGLAVELEGIVAIIAAAREGYSKPSQTKTKKERAMLALVERAADLAREGREIQALLATDGVNLDSAAGRIASLYASVRSAFAKNLPVLGVDFSEDMLTSYMEAMQGIQAKIAQHADAKECVDEGLASEKELAARAREEFRKAVSPLRSPATDLSVVVDQSIQNAIYSFIA